MRTRTGLEPLISRHDSQTLEVGALRLAAAVEPVTFVPPRDLQHGAPDVRAALRHRVTRDPPLPPSAFTFTDQTWSQHLSAKPKIEALLGNPETLVQDGNTGGMAASHD